MLLANFVDWRYTNSICIILLWLGPCLALLSTSSFPFEIIVMQIGCMLTVTRCQLYLLFASVYRYANKNNF